MAEHNTKLAGKMIQTVETERDHSRALTDRILRRPPWATRRQKKRQQQRYENERTAFVWDTMVSRWAGREELVGRRKRADAQGEREDFKNKHVGEYETAGGAVEKKKTRKEAKGGDGKELRKVPPEDWEVK